MSIATCEYSVVLLLLVLILVLFCSNKSSVFFCISFFTPYVAEILCSGLILQSLSVEPQEGLELEKADPTGYSGMTEGSSDLSPHSASLSAIESP